MDDARLIVEVGHTLWGRTWKAPMAEAVRHEKGIVADWASGRIPVPAGVWSELPELMRQRRHEFDELAPRIQRAHDAALKRTVEETRLGRAVGQENLRAIGDPQHPVRLPEGFAPRPVATPDLTGPNDEWILLPTGRQLGLRSDGLYPFPEEFQVLRSARALDVNQRRMSADPAVFGSQMAIH